MGLKLFVGLAIVIQIVFLVAIFDIYFKSPIVSGVMPIANDISAPSQRVVVISVDGLRLDALLEDDPTTSRPIAPYIRWIMSNHSTWGVSHCRLPTESRPGHVAMLAGFYEDPSAVTKGWKENPVDFDSIFNRSTCSFSWGSPDIVNIFHKGLKHDCSFKWVYSESQDFAGNTMELDNWVLREVETFFKASGNPKLYSQPKSLFFLHLLGQDTSGHTHKPKTDSYRENLRNVDRIVREVGNLFNNVFRDNGTAFVLTADHGMTDWGSHGAGDPTETLTPIVAWGAGVKSGVRVEINQADITPLLAVLLGVSIPVNSVGILPIDFLNVSLAKKSENVMLNAMQLSQQYLAKRASLESKARWTVYKKFPLDRANVDEFRNSIFDDIRAGKFQEANNKSRKLIQLSMDGIQFYHDYYQRFLFVLIVYGYLTWIMFLVFHLLGVKTDFVRNNTISLFSVSSIASFLLYLENFPATFHAYVQIPIFLTWQIAPGVPELMRIVNNFATVDRALAGLGILVGLELLVFSFYYRWVLSLTFFLIILWPIFNKSLTNNIKIWYFSVGLVLGGFSFLPVVGKQPQPVLIILGAISLAAYFAQKTRWGVLRAALISISGVQSFYIHKLFESEHKLDFSHHLKSWVLLSITPYLLTRSHSDLTSQLENSFAFLSVPFLLLTISHEGFFLLVLFIHLLVWLKIELVDIKTSFPARRQALYDNFLTLTDLRRAYVFSAYIYIAFFGLGNLATLNSFDPAWVRCFVTTFSPFLMTGLILLKVIIPFFAVTLALSVLTESLSIKPLKIFGCVFIFSNIMAINFLFLVKNQGSWLDIGTSLSHYVIQQVSIVFLLILYFVSQIVIGQQPDRLHYN